LFPETTRRGSRPGGRAMLHMDRKLAQRIEDASLRMAAVFAEALGPDSEVVPVADGLLITHKHLPSWSKAIGLGMTRPVSDADFDTLEGLFADRGLQGAMYFCPFCDPSVQRLASARHWCVDEWTNMLVRPLNPGDVYYPAGGELTIELVDEDHYEAWADLIARGFATDGALTEDDRAYHLGFARTRGVKCLIAKRDGVPAGAASIAMIQGEVSLLAASTLPEHRRHGIHLALIRHRLGMAAEAGCDLAIYGAVPGSPSQRNAERAGFRVAYTRGLLRRKE